MLLSGVDTLTHQMKELLIGWLSDAWDAALLCQENLMAHGMTHPTQAYQSVEESMTTVMPSVMVSEEVTK